MKIYVKDGNTGHKIRLALPSRLIFGKFGQAIVKCAIKSELKHNSSDEECVADTNIDADGLGMAELDDTTSFDTFDEEEHARSRSADSHRSASSFLTFTLFATRGFLLLFGFSFSIVSHFSAMFIFNHRYFLF